LANYGESLKFGFITPSLIANFKWTEEGKNQQEIRFYPFVSKKNLKKVNFKKQNEI